MINGEVVAAAQEERFTGLKGDYGCPSFAIEACLKTAGITSNQIDVVALSSHNCNPVLTKIKRPIWKKYQRHKLLPITLTVPLCLH